MTSNTTLIPDTTTPLRRPATADLHGETARATLITEHGQRTTLDALRYLPEPRVLGARHQPIPHATLIDGLLDQLDACRIQPTSAQYAISRGGAALFAAFTLRGPTLPRSPEGERSVALGLRSSTDSSLAIRLVAGQRVTVCDNLMLSGTQRVLARKSTTGLELHDTLHAGVARFVEDARTFEDRVIALRTRAYAMPLIAKATIYNLVTAGIVPARLLSEVHRYYFDERPPDCEPRSAWGLHNACTRAFQGLTPSSAYRRTVALGAFFHI